MLFSCIIPLTWLSPDVGAMITEGNTESCFFTEDDLVPLINRPILIFFSPYWMLSLLCSGFKIGILLSYLSWWSLQSVVYWETATPASFQALEISSQLTNWLKIRILFSWHSSPAVVLALELQLNHFEQVCLIFKMADWEHSTWIGILFWALPASHNT